MTQSKEKKRFFIICAVIAACVLTSLVETVLKPVYAVKTAIKLTVFIGTVCVYALIFRDKAPFEAFRRPSKKSTLSAVLFGMAVFAVIIGAYALLGPYFDFSAVTGSLIEKEGITAEVYPFTAAYISFGNSLLEEFFFRGFAFLTLKKAGNAKLAWIFSSATFAVYHISIMGKWFRPLLLVILTSGLFIGGLIFNWLDREGSLLGGCTVHTAADLAVNLIGMSLFGIIK